MVLDVGCGGGATVGKLAELATHGKVYGVDHSETSVAAATKKNERWIGAGRAEIRKGSVSQLPFTGGMFDVVTAVETHFWWPDLAAGMREILRVLRPGGTLVVVAEVYKGAQTLASKLAEKHAEETGMKLLSVSEHRELLEKTGYAYVQVLEEREKGWICALGKKPQR